MERNGYILRVLRAPKNITMILQHAFLAGRIILTIFVSIAVAIIGAGWKAYDTEIQRNTVMVICFAVTVILGLISWKGIKAQESFTEYYDGDRENMPDEYRVMDYKNMKEQRRWTCIYSGHQQSDGSYGSFP